MNGAAAFSMLGSMCLALVACGIDVAEEEIDGIKVRDVKTPEVLASARADYERGDYDRAYDFSQYIAESRPESRELDEARLLAADSMVAEGKLYKAFQQLKSLIEERPFTPHRAEVEEREFSIGITLFNDEGGFFGDVFSEKGHGVDVLTHFATTFTHNANAPDALRLVGGYYFDDQDWALALDQYSLLYNRYTESEWRDLAQFRIGMCHSLWVPGSDYDRTHMLMAERAFKTYLEREPPGTFHEEAVLELAHVEDRLAEKELKIAQFYILRGSALGTRLHLTNAVLAYPSTAAAIQARALLAERGWDLSINSLGTLEAQGGSFTDPLKYMPEETPKKKTEGE
jgi:outer membrane protein assembly factor BamD (BamD/ComL family)